MEKTREMNQNYEFEETTELKHLNNKLKTQINNHCQESSQHLSSKGEKVIAEKY